MTLFYRILGSNNRTVTQVLVEELWKAALFTKSLFCGRLVCMMKYSYFPSPQVGTVDERRGSHCHGDDVRGLGQRRLSLL